MPINPKLNYKTMLAAMVGIANMYKQGVPIGQLGITKDDMQVLQQLTLWSSQDRHQVQNVMQHLRDGFAVHQGFQPFAVPAEFQAALIAYFVAEVNYRAACAWLASVAVPAADLATGLPGGMCEPITDVQLFALVYECTAENPGFESSFNAEVSKQQQKIQQTPTEQIK